MSGIIPLMPDIRYHAEKSNGFVIELGVYTSEGSSTTAIQEGLYGHPNALHVSVDWEDRLREDDKPKTSWWRFVSGDSRAVETLYKVRQIMGERRPGMIFIDTDHNYNQMSAELGLWVQIATDETVWLGHDSWMYGVFNANMMRAVTEYAETNNWVYEDYRQDSHGLWRMRR